MNEFIEKNKKLLETYYVAARIVGWIMIVLTVMSMAGVLLLLMSDFKDEMVARKTVAELLANRLIFGIILLGVAQLIKFATDHKSKKPLLLRYGNMVLYFLAVVIFGICAARFCFSPEFYEHGSLYPFSNIMLYFLPSAANVLVLIGLGYFLQRIMPVIEESKTLV